MNTQLICAGGRMMSAERILVLLTILGALPLGLAKEECLRRDGPEKTAYLNNGTIKVGVDFDRGGAIGFLADVKKGGNVVNFHDLGRWIGQSYYSGPKPFGTLHPGWVRMNATPITDAGLANMKDLPRLEMLEARETGLTSDGLKYLKHYPLNWLDVSMTAVTDEGIKHLKDLPTLQTLRLSGLKITDAGLEELAELPNLRLQEIAGSRITDDGMKHGGKIKNLSWLMLTGTKVSDTGLEELHGLHGLRKLWVERMRNVTDAGVEKLKAALPNCRVIR